jgi:gliding motility-associated-like protein
MKSLLTFYFLLFTFYSFCQGEANKWYFGYGAGIDFNSGQPVAIKNSKSDTWEGCASIADPSGNLLFYTDGSTVWDRNNDTMPNGKDLKGSSSSTQSAVIIQKPGSTTTYYIFTCDAFGDANGLQYSEVDMTKRNGLGDISLINKNIMLFPHSCEKITGIRHCNNKDIWVVSHDLDTNVFRTFLVSNQGVSLTPVLSKAGSILYKSNGDFAGQLKAYSGGRKLAMAMIQGTLELYNFDNVTGKVSNPIVFDQTRINGIYGTEFSPDGTKLYASSYVFPSKLFQFDLCAGDSLAIANSGIEIGTTTAKNYGGSLQVAPDNKIYFSKWTPEGVLDSVKHLGIIENPNLRFPGCNYIDKGFFIGYGTSYTGIGLPNFVPYNLAQEPPKFTYSTTCLEGIFTAPVVTKCNQKTPISTTWNFGDTASVSNTSTLPNPKHTFTKKGTYKVQLILGYACGNDTVVETVTISMPTANAGKDTTIIVGGTASVTAQGGVSYVWDNGNNNQTLSVSPTKTTTYCVTMKDGNNCTDTDCILVTVKEPAPDTTCKSVKFTFSKDTTITLGATIQLKASGGEQYVWNTKDTTASLNVKPLLKSIYCVKATALKKCSDSTCITVDVIPPVIEPPKPDTTCKSAKFSYSSNQTIMLGDSLALFASGGGKYLWKTKDTTASIKISPQESADFCVVVTSPKACVDSACIHVQVNIPVVVPDGFSPNGDGINDVWHIKNIETYIAPKVSIYNRWGQAIIEEYDYSKPWDGTQDGVELPMATYYYVISLNDGKIKHQGTITLKR